jgi:hypothetical protein
MNKLLVLALALGSLAAACTPAPTNITINGEGGASGDGGQSGDSGSAGSSAGTSGASGSSGTAGASGAGPQEETARMIYLTKVHPAILDSCGTCHQASSMVGAPGWMDTNAETSYELSKAYNGVVTDPAADSIIITKPPHEGPALNDVQKPIVIEWLNKEIAEKNGDPGSTNTMTTSMTSTGKSVDQMLEEFGKCMNYDLWLADGMAKFPDQQTELGPCKSCHNQGLGGTYLSADPQMTFDKNSAMPFILRMVLPVYEGSVPVDLAPSLRFEQKGGEKCNNANPATCHPKYTLTPENVAAFEKFVGDTLTKWQSGTCL